jgi:hypothetical protein
MDQDANFVDQLVFGVAALERIGLDVLAGARDQQRIAAPGNRQKAFVIDSAEILRPKPAIVGERIRVPVVIQVTVEDAVSASEDLAFVSFRFGAVVGIVRRDTQLDAGNGASAAVQAAAPGRIDRQ